MANVKRNLTVGTSGIFQIISIESRRAAFSFRGWTSDSSNVRREYVQVEIGNNSSIELAIVRKKAPDAAAALAQQVVSFVQGVRRMELQKKPGIAETLDWTAALLRLGISVVDIHGAERIMDTLSALIKTRDDRVASGAVLATISYEPSAVLRRMTRSCVWPGWLLP